jgi:hypothetical protein
MPHVLAASVLLAVAPWGLAQDPAAARGVVKSAWGDAGRVLEPSVLDRLSRRSSSYEDVALRFACTERARWVRYDEAGAVKEGATKQRVYLLVRPANGFDVEERRDGREPRRPFATPPALSWALMFGDFYRPYFSYRDLGNVREGLDEVRRIGFRGAIPFRDGTDIRQWEGVVTLDAAGLWPIEVMAWPINQEARVEALYLREQRSMKISVGLLGGTLLERHSARKPLLELCLVRFAGQRIGLPLPAALELRTSRLVARDRAIPWSASLREYSDYRFFEVETSERAALVAKESR